MTRIPLCLLALLIVCLAVLADPVQIAPLAPRFGDLENDDYGARGASDGHSTLIVWINAFAPYQQTHRVLGAFVGTDGVVQGTAFPIAAPGTSPAVATNGDGYLVGYGVSFSRFNTFPYANVAVRTVAADGAMGAPRFINTSAFNYSSVTSIVWAGDQWIVGFYDGTAHLAFLGLDLEPKHPTIDAPSSGVIMIGGRPNLFAVKDGAATAYAIEDGKLVAGSSLILGHDAFPRAAPTRSGAIVTLQSGVDKPIIEVATYSPAAGWSTATKILEGQSPTDIASFGDGALLLHNAVATRSVAGTVLGSDGKAIETTVLGDFSSATLVAGSLLVASSETPLTGNALYAYPFTRLHKPSADERHLVSVRRIDRQFQPLICSAGSYAMAFWNQTIDDDGRVAAFSRRVDASGAPTGYPVQLPFTVGNNSTVAFNEKRFVIVWSGSAVSVSADGTSASAVVALEATQPQVAAAGNDLFAIWTHGSTLYGTPLNEDGSIAVPEGFPLLPSIRSQAGGPIAPLKDEFVAVWKEENDAGSMTLSRAGTPAAVKMIGRDVAAPLTLAGDTQAALAAWLSAEGRPVLVAIDEHGGSFDLFDPHWGDRFTAIAVRPSNRPSHFFVGLVKDGLLLVGETGQQGSFITAIGPLRSIARTANAFDLAAAGNTPVAIWAQDRRIFVSAPSPERRRSVRGR